jgi:hypothetical protein
MQIGFVLIISDGFASKAEHCLIKLFLLASKNHNENRVIMREIFPFTLEGSDKYESSKLPKMRFRLRV